MITCLRTGLAFLVSLSFVQLAYSFSAVTIEIDTLNTPVDNFTIGETHPELGGVIFYLNGEGGGLIADTEDLLNEDFDNISMFRWAELEQLFIPVNINYSEFNNWDATASRTDDFILEAYGSEGNFAAAAIRQQLGPEWRLPTATESYFLYFNLKQNGHGDLSDGFYWSSTEVPYNAAEITPPYVVATDMQTGDQSIAMSKVQALKIRAVRSF